MPPLVSASVDATSSYLPAFRATLFWLLAGAGAIVMARPPGVRTAWLRVRAVLPWYRRRRGRPLAGERTREWFAAHPGSVSVGQR